MVLPRSVPPKAASPSPEATRRMSVESGGRSNTFKLRNPWGRTGEESPAHH